MKRSTVALALVVIVLGSPSLAMPPAGSGGDSPQHVFDIAKAATEKGDYAGFFRCYAPDDRNTLTADVLMIASFMEKEKELKAIKDRHGVREEEASPVAEVKDKGALFAELMNLLDRESRNTLLISGELIDLKEEAKSAQGKYGQEPIAFVEEGGRWYIDAPDLHGE